MSQNTKTRKRIMCMERRIISWVFLCKYLCVIVRRGGGGEGGWLVGEVNCILSPSFIDKEILGCFTVYLLSDKY